LEAFLQKGLAARKKSEIYRIFLYFWHRFLVAVCLNFFVFLAAPARERT